MKIAYQCDMQSTVGGAFMEVIMNNLPASVPEILPMLSDDSMRRTQLDEMLGVGLSQAKSRCGRAWPVP